MPVDDPSGHLIFSRSDRRPVPVMLSLFLVPDNRHYVVVRGAEQVPVVPHRWIRLAEQGVAREVRIYSDGAVIYLMLACDASTLDAAAEGVERVLVAGP